MATTVYRARRGVQGQPDGLRAEWPRVYDDPKVVEPINHALWKEPDIASARNVRLMARAENMSKSAMRHRFALFGINSHRSHIFKLLDDPLFVEKARNVTGLCTTPSDNAMVLCVDGKNQIQVLNRTKPTLPPRPSHVKGYVPHGTTMPFSVFDMSTGKVIGKYRKRHRRIPVFARLSHHKTPPEPAFILFQATTQPIGIPRSRPGSSHDHTLKSHRLPPHTSTKWNDGSVPSASGPSSVDGSTVSLVSSRPH